MPRTRGNGEGSVYWREDRQCWAAAVTLPSGKRTTKSSKDKKEVQAWLIRTQAGLQQGQTPPKRQTVKAFLLSWLAAVQSTVKLSSYTRYNGIVHNHLIAELGRIELARLGAQRIEAYKAEKLKTLSPQTVRMHLALLSHALADACKWGVLHRNPCAAVDPPKRVEKEMQVYDEAQVGKLRRAAAEDRLGGLYIVAACTGMRQGELLGLRWEDIDFGRRVLQVRRTLWYWKKEFVVTSPKGNRARAVSLMPMAVEALQRRRDAQRLEHAAFRDTWVDSGYVWTVTRTGGPICPADLRIMYKRFLKRAGLPTIRFHDLRHTLATMLLTQGEHPRVVQELLGHSTAALTMDRYSHVMPTLQAQAMQRLHDRLNVATAVSEELTATALLPDEEDAPE